MAAGFSFISPGATGEAEVLDPPAISRRRRIAEAMIAQGADFSPIASPWQGLARMAQGVLGGYEAGALEREERDGRATAAAALSKVFGSEPAAGIDKVASAMTAPTAQPAAAQVPSFAGGNGARMALPGSGGATEGRFVDTLKAGGLTNPYGLAAMAAYAQHESRYSPKNITGSWPDPSESGQPGTSGGILSWRGDRLANMRRMTAGAADPVEAQAKFALTENPDLTLALQRAKSPEEAHRLMAEAWKFAGYNRPGGENDARLASTRAYVARLGGGPAVDPAAPGGSQVASADMPAGGAQPAGFVIPGQSAGQAAVSGALSETPRLNTREALAYIANPYANPAIGRVVASMVGEQFKPREYSYQNTPDGTILRLDPRGGAPQIAYQGTPKPDVDVRETNGRIVAVDRRTLTSQDVTPQGIPQSKLEGEVAERRRAILSQGSDPNDPRSRDYILTGKLPREDQQPLTAGDKKAINEAEDQLLGLDQTIATLNRAKELNPQTYTGTGAAVLGHTGTSFPGASLILDEKKAGATREFGQIMSMEAIKAMSHTLKGATTDAEMARFLSILGDPTTPPEIRGRTIDRMLALAERQKGLAQTRATDMRGGGYYKPGGGLSGGAPAGGGVPSAPRSGGAASSNVQALEAEARRRGLIQ